MAVMAVTGDIGAGKSTVSKLLSEKFNSEVFDADKIAKNLWELETVKNQAVSRWGKSIIDSEGNIIKSKISEFIFTNKDEWEFCNNLIHPKVMAELEKLSLKFNNVILEVPLLFEAKFHITKRLKIIYVTADFNIRAERCKLQRGWTIEELKRREKFLLPSDIKISMSDYVIYNDKSIYETGEKLNEFLCRN
ncbi:MAG: dephospho-CoA kinase [Synergistaceae bacterium]|nr:dephospho-CoA kinase [Synergistaceae bacterium]